MNDIATNLRVSSHESGNTSDFNEYIRIGGTCVGIVWRELLPEHHHDYRVTRRVWRESHDPHVEHPTRIAAIRAVFSSLPNVLDFSEVDDYQPFKLEKMSRDEREKVA